MPSLTHVQLKHKPFLLGTEGVRPWFHQPARAPNQLCIGTDIHTLEAAHISMSSGKGRLIRADWDDPEHAECLE